MPDCIPQFPLDFPASGDDILLDNRRIADNIVSMKTTSDYNTTVSIGNAIGCSPDTVGRIARVNQIGTQLGDSRLTATDIRDLILKRTRNA